MTLCPYPESSDLYEAWHEGYEGHKLEIIGKVKFINIYNNELIADVIELKILTRKLRAQIDAMKAIEPG